MVHHSRSDYNYEGYIAVLMPRAIVRYLLVGYHYKVSVYNGQQLCYAMSCNKLTTVL